MSAEDYEIFRMLKAARKELRTLHAVACPVCVNRLPKAHPTMLLPQERCRIHGYRDERPRVSNTEVDTIFAKYGITRSRNGATKEST